MPNYRRYQCPGGCYFVTLVTYKRQCFLTRPDNRELLRNSFDKVRSRWPFTLQAFCLLPDHLHCILTLPPEDADLAVRWNLIKGHFSRNHPKTGLISKDSLSQSRVKRRERGVWQRRYWAHLIEDQNDFNVHIDYIHYNPVKHGLVQRAADYPWSTIHNYIKDGFYPDVWGTSAGLNLFEANE